MPDIQAQTADGVIHSFPDGTPDGVVDKAVKDYIASSGPVAPKPDPLMQQTQTAARAAGESQRATMPVLPKPEYTGPVSRAVSGIANGMESFKPSLPDKADMTLMGAGPLPSMARHAYGGYKAARGAGEPIGESIAEGAGGALGLNSPGIRERAQRGDVAGVIGEAVPAIAATTVAPEIAKRGYAAVKGIDLGPTEIENQRNINASISAKPKNVRAGEGGLEDASTMPGRGLAKEGLKAKDLAKLTPDEQIAKIGPLREKAGNVLSVAVDDATKRGVKFDGGKSAYDTLKKIDNPDLQEKAIDAFNGVAKDIGIKDLRNMTPSEAWQLRRALDATTRFAGDPDLRSMSGINWKLRNAVRSDMHAAVPELAPLDQHYSDLKSATQAITTANRKFAVTPKTTTVQKIGKVLDHPLSRTIAAGAGAGAGYRFLRGGVGTP